MLLLKLNILAVTGIGAGATGGATVDTPAETVGDKIKKYLPGVQASCNAQNSHIFVDMLLGRESFPRYGCCYYKFLQAANNDLYLCLYWTVCI